MAHEQTECAEDLAKARVARRPRRHCPPLGKCRRAGGACVGPLTNLGGHRQGLVVEPLCEQLGVHAGQLVLVPRCRAGDRGRTALTSRVRKTALRRVPWSCHQSPGGGRRSRGEPLGPLGVLKLRDCR